MRTFQSHKRVKAAQILEVHTVDKDGGCLLTLEGERGTYATEDGFSARGVPKPGDYLVVYDDGYESWSPKNAFERGYLAVPSDGFGFGRAIKLMQGGYRVARAGWNGKGMWLCLSPGGLTPAEKFWAPANRAYAEQNGGGAMVLPYITMKTADGGIVPWMATQTDMLADDWELLD